MFCPLIKVYFLGAEYPFFSKIRHGESMDNLVRFLDTVTQEKDLMLWIMSLAEEHLGRMERCPFV